MIEEYLTGRLVARVRAEIPDGAVGAPGMRPRTRLRLYCSEDDQELMVSGDKDVEARVGVGTAAAVREGHLILLGDIRVRVLEVKRFADAAELLQHVGFHRVFPEAVALDEAVGVFSAIRGHDEKVQRDGMIGFVFDVAKDDDVALKDLDTCHAAYALHEDPSNPAASLTLGAQYALQVIDEVSQLDATNFERIVKTCER